MPLQQLVGLEGFEKLEHLPERLALFEQHLAGVDCESPDGRCLGQSKIRNMCAVCQVKMFFVHTVHNWDAYHPAPPGMGGSFTE